MRLSIGKKLYLSFGLVVVLMLGIVGVSINAERDASDGVGEVAEMMDDTTVAAEMLKSMLMMRLSMKDYLLTNAEESYAKYNTWEERFVETHTYCSENFSNPGRQENLALIGEKFGRYDKAFNEVYEIIKQRNGLVKNKLDVIGPQIVAGMQEYRADRIQSGESESVHEVAKFGDRLLEVRIAAMKYVRTNSEADLKGVLTRIDDAVALLESIKSHEASTEAIAALDSIETGLNEYAGTFRSIDALIKKRNQLVLEQMDVLGVEIADIGADLFASLKEDSHHTREAVDASIHRAGAIMIGAALVAVGVAVVVAVLVSRGISGPIHGFLTRFELIAKGDFTQRVDCKTKDEIGDLASGFNNLIGEIAEVIGSVQTTSNNVAAAATEVAATSEQMASSADNQRSQLMQVAAAIEELSATINDVSNQTGEVSARSGEAGRDAAEGGEIVTQTVSEMGQIATQVESTSAAVGQLSEKAAKIGEILTVINDIADQTNLLALNAAIEAARAGEHGRGFAVVADEVRKLAERTQHATQEVSQSIAEIRHSTDDATRLMTASKDKVSGGVQLAEKAGLSLSSIVTGSSSVAQSVDSIAAAVEEQSATSLQIARSIESITQSAEESSAGAGQASTAATQLSSNAEELRVLISRFKI